MIGLLTELRLQRATRSCATKEMNPHAATVEDTALSLGVISQGNGSVEVAVMLKVSVIATAPVEVDGGND